MRQNIEIPDAPDAPPVLTVGDLIPLGHARTVATSKSGHHIHITAEGHRLLGENQRLRAERNRAWRAGANESR